MKRFKETSNGYKFDRVIFLSVIGFTLLVLAGVIGVYGLEARPYFLCKSETCINPFYDADRYGCSYGGGFIPCKVKNESWMNEAILSKGEYGTKPILYQAFLYMLGGLLLLAFTLNHFLYNRGIDFNIELADKMRKWQNEKTNNKGNHGKGEQDSRRSP